MKTKISKSSTFVLLALGIILTIVLKPAITNPWGRLPQPQNASVINALDPDPPQDQVNTIFMVTKNGEIYAIVQLKDSCLECHRDQPKPLLFREHSENLVNKQPEEGPLKGHRQAPGPE